MSSIPIHPTRRVQGPHQRIAASDDRERFALELLDLLWKRYRARVPHVTAYESLLQQAGVTFANDHLAFRPLASQRPVMGTASISRVAEALGYVSAGLYHFPNQHLSAAHYQHPNPGFPKLFISELRVWEVSSGAREAVGRTVATYHGGLTEEALASLVSLKGGKPPPGTDLLETLTSYFHELPWEPPQEKNVRTLDQESQYTAWVLVHGHNVNHCTALANAHGVRNLDDIEKTVEALRRRGVPMKAKIEGERGSRLRQTATEAPVVPVTVREGTAVTSMPWPYAYFEIAERGEISDPDAGRRTRFQGFLGPQAANLFQVTKRGT